MPSTVPDILLVLAHVKFPRVTHLFPDHRICALVEIPTNLYVPSHSSISDDVIAILHPLIARWLGEGEEE